MISNQPLKLTMAVKSIQFICLVIVALGVSAIADCDVETTQNIDVKSCSLATQTEDTVDGWCPTDITRKSRVCKDVTTKMCHDRSNRCSDRIERHCEETDVVRTIMRPSNGETCTTKIANCEDNTVVAPKTQTCKF